MTETEVKIRIEDPGDFEKRIRALGAQPVLERHKEENILYDFPSGELRRKGRALRLRIRDGGRSFLTFKGPLQRSRSFKVREEFETEVRNPAHAKKILRGLGLQAAFRYEKFRTVYRKKRLKVFLDETAVGVFCELEGQRSDIVRFAKALGYARRDFIKKDYVQLLIENKKGI